MVTGELAPARNAAHPASGFLQTGELNLAVREKLPAPGWLTRLLLRNTPIPVLIHSLLDELQAQRSLQFVEDRYMPEPFLRYLHGRGLPLGASDSFFLHDRQPLRGGLVLAGRAPGEAPAELRDFAAGLRTRLVHWLRMADRGPDAARLLTVEDARDFFSRRFVHYEPVGVLLWAAEASPMERWFGARWSAPTKSWQKALQSAGDMDSAVEASALDAMAVAPVAEGPSAQSESSLHAESALVGRTMQPARAVSRSASAAGAAPISTAAGDPALTAANASADHSAADPTETVHSAGKLEYQVVGRTRGPTRGGRKYHIRREGEYLRIALLAAGGERLKADHALAFFDRLQFAGDLIRAHRDLLRALPAHTQASPVNSAGRSGRPHESLSLELNCETGAFRCVAYGITPLFFRRKNGRLYPLPDSSAPQGEAGPNGLRTLKTVEGVFHPGDALLLMPGGYTASERRDLAGRFRELLAGSAESAGGDRIASNGLAASLGPWLDARLRGRGLLLGRP